MTCGVCDPVAFQTGDGMVLGYLVASHPHRATMEARKLYYLGAKLVLSDMPRGRLSSRPGWKALKQCLRAGDRLILPSVTTLVMNRVKAAAYLEELEKDGIDIFFLKPEYFEDEEP